MKNPIEWCSPFFFRPGVLLKKPFRQLQATLCSLLVGQWYLRGSLSGAPTDGGCGSVRPKKHGKRPLVFPPNKRCSEWMFGRGNGGTPLIFCGKNSQGWWNMIPFWPDFFWGCGSGGRCLLLSCGVVNLILVENCWMNCAGMFLTI